MPGDSKFDKVALLLRGQTPHGSELIVDESLPAKLVASRGGASNTTAVVKYGTAALSFDGTSGYAVVASANQLEFGASDFCVECWINTTSTLAYAAVVTRNSSGFGVGSWGMYINTTTSAGDVVVYMRDFSASVPLLTSQGVNIRDGSWHHIAWVRNGALHYLLVDGVLRALAQASFTVGTLTAEEVVVANDKYFTPRKLAATLDDVRITVGDCRYTLTPAPPSAEAPTASPADPSFASVSTLLRGNGTDGSTTFTDDATTPKTYTVFGDAQISTAQKKFGSASMKFDGAGDYLTTAAHADFDLSGSDYTVECWVRFAAVSAAPHVFQLGTSLGARMALFLSSGQLYFYNGISYATGFSPVINQWYHLALVKQGNMYYVLVDGAPQWGAHLTGTPTPTGNLSVGVGAQHYSPGADDYLNGWVDDFRVTKGVARYLAEVGVTAPTAEADNFAARVSGVIRDSGGTPVARDVFAYHRCTGALLASAQSDASTGAYTLRLPQAVEVSRVVMGLDPAYDPLRANVELALRCDGADNSTTITDISTVARSLTCSGSAKLKTAQKKFGSASLYIDGTAGGYVSATASPSNAFGVGDFTIDFWLYQTARASGGANLVDTLTLGGASARANSFTIRVFTDGQIGVYFASNWRVQGGYVPLNIWTHVALERKSGVMSLYLNGALIGSTTTLLNDTLGGLFLGVPADATTDPAYTLTGYLDDIRFTRGAARFQGAFLPPAYAQPDPTNSTEALQNDLVDRVIPG